MAVSYNLAFPSPDDTIPHSITLENFFNSPGITIPVNTRASIVFDPIESFITSITNLDEVGIEIPTDGSFFGPDIVQTDPIKGKYTLRQMQKGLTLSTYGTAQLGNSIATVTFNPILYYDQQVFLTGKLILNASMRGKIGYRRTRFS